MTNRLIAELSLDLLETPIQTIWHNQDIPTETGGMLDITPHYNTDHAIWCGMTETGHRGPCRAHWLTPDISGVMAVTLAKYSNGDIAVGITWDRCFGDIPTDLGMNQLVRRVLATIAWDRQICQ